MNKQDIGRVCIAVLLAASGAGSVYSEHHVELSSSAICAADGALTIPKECCCEWE